MAAGFVYVLTNPSMPGLVKIGMTERTPRVRAKELSDATGVPTPFAVAWQVRVADCAAVEGLIHRALDRWRTNGRREFFRVDAATAAKAIEAALGVHGAAPAVLVRLAAAAPRRPARRRRRTMAGGAQAALAAASLLAAVWLL